MRAFDPKRDCRSFPAFPGGPREFYEDRPRPARTPRPRVATPPERPAHARTRNRVMFLPAFDLVRLGQAFADPPPRAAPRPAAPPAGPALLAPLAPRVPQVVSAPEWWESPVAIGLALAFLPPLGVTVLWASRRVPTQGKVAATAVTSFCVAVAAMLFLFLR